MCAHSRLHISRTVAASLWSPYSQATAPSSCTNQSSCAQVFPLLPVISALQKPTTPTKTSGPRLSLSCFSVPWSPGSVRTLKEQDSPSAPCFSSMTAHSIDRELTVLAFLTAHPGDIRSCLTPNQHPLSRRHRLRDRPHRRRVSSVFHLLRLPLKQSMVFRPLARHKLLGRLDPRLRLHLARVRTLKPTLHTSITSSKMTPRKRLRSCLGAPPISPHRNLLVTLAMRLQHCRQYRTSVQVIWALRLALQGCPAAQAVMGDMLFR